MNMRTSLRPINVGELMNGELTAKVYIYFYLYLETGENKLIRS